ncbi:MAG TPA: DUF2630 family protein [Stellaceae bacterium]|nr:DUF2630 family protein [Stellaceae bacterium]
MKDQDISAHIDQLAREEHVLLERDSHGKATEADAQRLREIETTLDQCWDLLRQRRAKRAAGQNPDEAHVRDARTVKNYIG